MVAVMKFMKGRRVCITGHTGFKGSWLTLWLSGAGASVLGISRPPVQKNLFSQLTFRKNVHSVFADVEDFNKISRSINNFSPEIVFHLAAQPLVRLSYEYPRATFLTNIQGTVNVLEVVRLCKTIRALVCVTSDKCYDNAHLGKPFIESDRMGGADPYSASKGAAELVFSAYLKSFFLKQSIGAATARAGNIIGGGDWSSDRLVPDIVRAITRRKEILIRHPSFIRPWQHVLDPLYGYILLAKNLLKSPAQYSGAWNFGPRDHDSKSVLELVESMIQLWGKGKWKTGGRDKARPESMSLRLNCLKSEQKLGWSPQWDFRTSVEYTTRWYREFYAGKAAQDLCLKDIDKYQEWK